MDVVWWHLALQGLTADCSLSLSLYGSEGFRNSAMHFRQPRHKKQQGKKVSPPYFRFNGQDNREQITWITCWHIFIRYWSCKYTIKPTRSQEKILIFQWFIKGFLCQQRFAHHHSHAAARWRVHLFLSPLQGSVVGRICWCYNPVIPSG